MSDYLDSVREIERRIQRAEEQNAKNPELPALDRPDGIPPTFEEHIQLMYDMMTLAFQADLTRVITFMYSREGGNRTYPQVGVPDAHHGLSHHMNDPAKDGPAAEDRPASCADAELLPGQDAGRAGRRRHAAGSFHGGLRRQLERFQPPPARQPSGALSAASSRAAGMSAIPRARP